MLLPESNCAYIQSEVVCIQCFKSIAPWVCLYHFWPFFGPDMKTEMGVVICMYLKHSPDYIDSKYMSSWI